MGTEDALSIKDVLVANSHKLVKLYECKSTRIFKKPLAFGGGLLLPIGLEGWGVRGDSAYDIVVYSDTSTGIIAIAAACNPAIS